MLVTLRKVNLRATIMMALLCFYPVHDAAGEDPFVKGVALIETRQYERAIEAFSEACGTGVHSDCPRILGCCTTFLGE